MIIARFSGLPSLEERQRLERKLEEFFDGEKVLLISENVELIFRDDGKKRCGYCGRLNTSTTTCESCGGIL